MAIDNFSFGDFDFDLDPEIQKQYEEIMAQAGMPSQDPMQSPELTMPEMQFQPQQDMPALTGMEPTAPNDFLNVNQEDISGMAAMPDQAAANASTEDLKAKLRERLMQRLSSYDPAAMESEKQKALKEAEPGMGREIASVVGSALMGGAGKVAFADLEDQTRKKKAQIEGQYGVKQKQYDKDMDAYNDLMKMDATERLREIQSAKMIQDMKASELDLMLKKKAFGDAEAARDPNSEQSMFAKQTVRDVYKIDVPESANALQLKPYLDKAPNLMIEKAKSVASFEGKSKLQEMKLQSEQSKKDLAPTEAEKVTEREFAKDYNEWTSRGQGVYQKNLDRLKEAKNTLEQRQKDFIGTSGRVTGRLPDFLRSEESIALREDVQAAAQGALKATLGAQFTEKEGERIMAASYNEKLSPEQNIKKIDAAIKEIETNAKNLEDKGRYYEENRGLKGYKAPKAYTESSAKEEKSIFPLTVRKDGKIATVKNQKELDEANSEGWR